MKKFKMKTHSGSKKRFRFTASGKIRATQANDNHYRRNKKKSTLKTRRKTTILCKSSSKVIAKKMLPYG